MTCLKNLLLIKDSPLYEGGSSVQTFSTPGSGRDSLPWPPLLPPVKLQYSFWVGRPESGLRQTPSILVGDYGRPSWIFQGRTNSRHQTHETQAQGKQTIVVTLNLERGGSTLYNHKNRGNWIPIRSLGLCCLVWQRTLREDVSLTPFTNLV